MTLKQILFPTATACCATALFIAAPVTNVRADTEWEGSTAYYEDDAWYDLSEWFDGNDYNPTDEAAGRWDDETYDVGKDIGTDQDSDNWGYGYSTQDDNDWFYDYYDTQSYNYSPSDDDTYDYVSRYYDYDNDGKYDAYVSYADLDNDGTYEDFTYLAFNDQGKQNQAKNQQNKAQDQKNMSQKQDWQKRQQQAKADTPQSSKQQQLTGTIEQTKTVKARNGQHTVVQLKSNDKMVNVDLGPTEGVQSLNLKQGSQIQVTGPMIKVGDKQIVQARQLTVDGNTKNIETARRSFTGNVTAVKTAKVRGQTHQIAIIDSAGDQSGKIAVDLGPKDQLGMDVKKDSQLTVTGMPVKIQNRQILIAHSVKTPDGKTMQINRSNSQKGGTASVNE